MVDGRQHAAFLEDRGRIDGLAQTLVAHQRLELDPFGRSLEGQRIHARRVLDDMCLAAVDGAYGALARRKTATPGRSRALERMFHVEPTNHQSRSGITT